VFVPSTASCGAEVKHARLLPVHGQRPVGDPELLRVGRGSLPASEAGSKGIEKFLAYEIPLSLAKERYAKHFDMVCRDLSQTDDLRVLDYNGQRALHLFTFGEMGTPVTHEPDRSR
jgi:hypothetical protein